MLILSYFLVDVKLFCFIMGGFWGFLLFFSGFFVAKLWSFGLLLLPPSNGELGLPVVISAELTLCYTNRVNLLFSEKVLEKVYTMRFG